MAVTWQVRYLPLSALVVLYVEAVLPDSAVVPRNHWYLYVVGVGLQVPCEQVSVLPTSAVPTTLGAVVATKVPLAMVFAALVCVTVVLFFVVFTAHLTDLAAQVAGTLTAEVLTLDTEVPTVH